MKRSLKLLGVLIIAGASLAGSAGSAQTSRVFCPQVCIFKCLSTLVCCKVDGCFGCHRASQCD